MLLVPHDLDPDACRRALAEYGFAERECVQEYPHGYGQWWLSPNGSPTFLQWERVTKLVKAQPFQRLMDYIVRNGGRC